MNTPNHDTRAVQYLRMSTEHQRYSLENQRAAIAEYAAMEGYEIIRTYSDAGKSGLQLKGRRQLQQLLSDCLNPERDFETILVLDVSRWGRFQDPDQAAYYEYICRGAGVRVAYVGETFDNDGGLVSSIVKHLKRVMAAEYSRELSARITRAKLQQARLGFRQGGAASYGFRRQLVEAGDRKPRTLKPGEYKGIHTDRVTTTPGPADEQETVRRIFRLFLEKHRTFAGVARQLNAEGVPNGTDRPWSARRVSHLIRNELCIGRYVYNRTNRHLRQALRRRPREEWVQVPVMEPLVTDALFVKARRAAAQPRYRYSDKDLLRALRRHLKKHGRVSPDLMKRDPDMPHPKTYQCRFGSIGRACEQIGYAYQGRRMWRSAIRGYWSGDAIIAAVRRCSAEHGSVSAAMLNADPALPSVGVINRRFGSLLDCYDVAGVPLTPIQRFWKEWMQVRPRRYPLVPEGVPLGPITTALLSRGDD